MNVLPVGIVCTGLGFLFGSVIVVAPRRWPGAAGARALFLGSLLVALVGALLASARPTELRPLDIALRCAVALAFGLSVLAARPAFVGATTALLVGAVAIGGAQRHVSVLLLVLGFATLGLTVAGLAQRDVETAWASPGFGDHRPANPGQQSAGAVLRALLAAGVPYVALRVPTSLPPRLPSLVVGIALAVVVVSGLVRASVGSRRIVGRTVALASLLAIVGSVAGALTLRGAKSTAERGVDLAKAGLASARAGDQAGAEALLVRAQAALLDAHSALGSPVARLGLGVPVVAQHFRTLDRLSVVASDVVVSARLTSGEARTSSFKSTNGELNLPKIAQLAAALAATTATLDRATSELERPFGVWLLPQVTGKLTGFRRDIRDANGEAKVIRELAIHLPAILGGQAPRHYLLVVPSPAEARGSGGVIGNFGEITASNGRISLTRFGRNRELSSGGVPLGERVAQAPADYLRRYKRFAVDSEWSNVNMSPDFVSSAQAMASLYPQSGGREVDGVISVDPFALQALLGVLGPLSVQGWPVALDETNTATVLLRDAYIVKEDSLPERITLLADVTRGVWEKLRANSLPNPRRLVDRMAPVVANRHLQIWMRNPEEQTYLDTVGITGRILPLDGDGFGVVVNNASGNKIEYFLHRTVDYSASVSPLTGQVRATATIGLRNDAPAGGLPDYLIGNSVVVDPPPKGTSLVYVSFYSPLTLTSISVDGHLLPDAEVERETEFGRNVYSAWLRLPSRSTRSVRLTLSGRVPVPDGRYRLTVFSPPAVNPDELTVAVLEPSTPATNTDVLPRLAEHFAMTAPRSSVHFDVKQRLGEDNAASS